MPQADFKALNELIRSSGLSFRENSKSWIFTCPKCEKPDKLYMFKDAGENTGRFVCWICKETEGFAGRPEFALREMIGMPLSMLKKKLYGFEEVQGGMFLSVHLKDFFGDGDTIDEDAGELERQVWPPDYYPIDHKFSARGLAYLQGRGINLELAQAYGLRYCPPDRRVIFPIESEGVLYGWQARYIEQTEYLDPESGDIFKTPKIRTSKGVKKEYTLMFMDRLNGSDHAAVTEGPVDGIKIHLCGGNAVTMGKAVSRQQIQLLRNGGFKKIYIGMDKDAGLETLRLAREFHDLECYRFLPLEPYEDLGEAPLEANLTAFRAAPRVHGAMLMNFVERDWETLDKRIHRHRTIQSNRRARGAPRFV